MFKEYDFSIKETKDRILLFAVLTGLILLGTHTRLFSFLAFVISALVILFDRTHLKLMLMTYLTLMAHVFKISPSGMSYFTFLMFIYIGVKLMEDRSVLWIVIFFVLYVVTIQIIRDQIHINEDIKLFGNIMFIGYSLSELYHCNEKDIEGLCVAYISSVLASSVMRFFDSGFFRISAYTHTMNTEGYGAGVERIVRFSGLYQDPNYYTVNLIMALCLIVMLYYKGNISILFCVFSAGLLLYFGTLTYSKSFLLMLLLPLLLFLYANQRIGRYDVQIISIAAIAAGVLLILLLNPDYITRMSRRINAKRSLTTGRDEEWMLYIGYIYTHPDLMLFGAGIGAFILGDHAAHNSYIDILYYLGVVGGFLLIIAVVSSGLLYRKRFRKNFMNFSLWLSILITYFFLSQLHSYEFPIHFMLAFMVLNQWDLSRREEKATAFICQPLLPGLHDRGIKTL